MSKKKQRTGGRYRGRNVNGRNNNNNGAGNRPGGQGGYGGGQNHRSGSGGQYRRRPYGQDQGRREYEAPDSEYLPLTPGTGVLEMHPNGYGFLRDPGSSFERERTDPFVPGTMIEKFGLREGVLISGMVQHHRKQQGPRLREILDVDGMAPEDFVNVKTFDQLTPINPEEWLRLETAATPLTTRVMDLLTPLGKGQRALIVAPPRTGKTVLMQQTVQAISVNYPQVTPVVLLIDERPEEVTDMRRNVNGEVFASSLDKDVESHVRLAQLVIARCQRLAEMGKDVFLVMDSITRLARAFNKFVGNSGPVMSGGVNIKAMDVPKKLFATARAFEEGGSLTIVGTALIDTGSRMDELIFQEFKGTGNMELVLDRKLSDRRVYPAIDIEQSGTRREEKLLPPEMLHAVTMLRRTLSSMHHVDAMEQLTSKLAKFKSNAEFVMLIQGAHSLE
ncbi:MAG TPA: transcription termination factor Rho [Lacipirellulaceae bacterium]|nr:transcription termination factor Rho [Lacipirellulaceae bacterium]